MSEADKQLIKASYILSHTDSHIISKTDTEDAEFGQKRFQQEITDGFQIISEALIEYAIQDQKDPFEASRPFLKIIKAVIKIEGRPEKQFSRTIPLYQYAHIQENDLSAIFGTIERLINDNRDREAVFALKVLICLVPHVETMWYSLGVSLFKLERYEEASSALKHALALNREKQTEETYLSILILLYRSLNKENKRIEALQYLDDAISNPQHNPELKEALQEAKKLQ